MDEYITILLSMSIFSWNCTWTRRSLAFITFRFAFARLTVPRPALVLFML